MRVVREGIVLGFRVSVEPRNNISRTLDRERTAPSMLGMARKDAKKDLKKKVVKKKLPWSPSEVKLVFARLMAFGAPIDASPKPTPPKGNYACEDFHLAPEQWVAKTGVHLETKSVDDVHQFVLQLRAAAAQASKVAKSVPKSSGTSPAPTSSTILVSATASKPAAADPDTNAADTTEATPVPALTKIKVSRVRLKQLDGRLKLLHDFRCKVLSRPEAALLRNLRNVKSSKIKRSKLTPTWWSLRHDVQLLLGKAACMGPVNGGLALLFTSSRLMLVCRGCRERSPLGRHALQRAARRPTRDAVQFPIPLRALENHRQSAAQD